MSRVKLTEVLFLVLVALAIVIGVWSALTGCAHDGCRPDAMRCRANNVELCDSEGDWYVVDHCGQVEPLTWDWTCCPVDDLVACLPGAECDGGADGK